MKTRRLIVFCFAVCAAVLARAEPVCVDGVCYLSEEDARAAGVVLPVTDGPAAVDARVKIGATDAETFVAFLRGEETSAPADDLEHHSVAAVFLLILLGGLAANLTPCVLPLVPVNLALVGKGAARGAAYGLGIALAYGALGLAAAFGGLAFGAIQSSPWFNAVTAAVFLALALAMADVFVIDLARFRPGVPVGAAGTEKKRGLVFPFLLGAGAAVLAGACVEPILLATLLLTAKWFAAGRAWALALPFVLGAGMGLPWPFAAAGLSVLPRPGAWMRWVNRVFACVLAALAVWYGALAARGWWPRSVVADERETHMTAEDRPKLIIVGAAWCKNCAVMERTVLKEPAVVKELARFAVERVEIETPDDLKKHAVLRGMDIPGVPAYVIVNDSKEEKRK